jgi:hypothetical protein
MNYTSKQLIGTVNGIYELWVRENGIYSLETESGTLLAEGTSREVVTVARIYYGEIEWR